MIYSLKAGAAIPVPSPWVIPGVEEQKNLDVYDYIIKLVCARFEVKEKIVMSKTRKVIYCLPRQIIMSLIKKNFPKIAMAKIGHRCGGYDHATVLHACRAMSNYVETNKDFRTNYSYLDGVIKMKINQFIQTPDTKKEKLLTNKKATN